MCELGKRSTGYALDKSLNKLHANMKSKIEMEGKTTFGTLTFKTLQSALFCRKAKFQ